MRAACLVLALALALPARGDEAAPAYDVKLDNGRVLAALSAVRDGSTWIVVLPSGTLRLPAARVVSVSERGGDDEAARGGAFNVLEAAAPDAAAGDAEAPPTSFERKLVTGRSERELRDALVASPGDGRARVELGALLLASGRFAEAREHLQAASGLSKALELERGLCLAEALSRLDRTDEALAVLGRLPASDPRVTTFRRALEIDEELRLGRVIHETPHFTIQAPPATTALGIEGLARELEAVHASLAEELGGEPREKVIVILYPGDEFWESTGMDSRIVGLFDGKVRVPAGRIDPPSAALRSVLRHEVAHAFVDALSAGGADRTWQEGIAEHFEGDDIRAFEAALAARRRESPASWPPAFDHPTSHSLVEYFLATHGMGGLRSLLAALARGATTDEAIRQVTGAGEADLHAAWGDRLAGAGRR